MTGVIQRILKLVARGFLRVLRLPPLLHRFNRVDLYGFFFLLRCFSIIVLCFRLLYAIVLSSDVFDACARARVCVVHWHCTAQLSMLNMEKRFRNKIIIIIIISWLSP